VGEDGRVRALRAARVEFDRDALERPLMNTMREVPGSEFDIPADLVLLAMGFVGPVREGIVDSLSVELDPRGNVRADTKSFATSEPGVFAAGDARRGQSLVVWAQWEGREAARAVDAYLVGASRLPARNAYV
jgi:glutamate synthase (NADPH/NADH) small chain